MDLSDDIAYSVHDFEDAIVSGFIDVPALGSRVNHGELVDSMFDWIGGEFSHDELIAAFDRLDSLEPWIEDFSGSRLDNGRLKNLTSQLIGRFVGAAIQATLEKTGGESRIRFGGEIFVPRTVRAEIAVLKGIVAANVMSANSRKPVYSEQREILIELADALFDRGPAGLDAGFAFDWSEAASDSGRKRVVVDQVASLTDQSAKALHRKLASK